MRRKLTYGALLAGTFGLTLFASWTQFGAQIDNDAYDFMFRLHKPPAWEPESVVLAIDEPSFKEFRGIYGLRPALAQGLAHVASARPKAVALDVILHDASNEQADALLERAMQRTPRLVLATDLLPNGAGWEDPLPRFQKWAVATGHVHGQPDEFDAVIREIALEKAAGRDRRWALALEAYRVSRGAQIIESPRDLTVGGNLIPASRKDGRSIRVRYRHPASGRLPTISLLELHRDPARAAAFAGKTVFVGITAQTAARDRPMTPYSYGMIVPGVEVHAHAYETIAQRIFLTSAPVWTVAASTALVVAAAGLIFWFLVGWRAYLCSGILLAGVHLLPFALFTQRVVFPFTPLVSSAWTSIVAAGAFQYFAVRRRLRRAESEKSRYQQAMHFVTHEMRTPLTAIQGSSELISRYAMTDDKRKQVANLINSESKRLGRMIETFLNVERLSAGQVELKKESFSASDLIAVCTERARPLAERKQIRITPGEMPGEILSGDRELIEYAYYNLLTNAIKYSPQNTEVTVFGRREGERVRMSVQDQGIGLDKQEMGQVFQKFYRTSRAERSGEAGTGIGLSIVQEIVQLHGGAIDLTSRPGAGSCFTLILPARVAAAVNPS
jgi:signal transduction histidine kinase